MRFWFLVGSLTLLGIGALLSSDWLMAAGGVGCLCALAGWGGAPRHLVLGFGFWTAAVLAYLLHSGDRSVAETGTLGGLPRPSLWMLLGIWVVPVFIWPLGFLRHFRRWKGQ